ncbi:hypothetical protein ACJRO7_022073 [Eucalyptus globulus]|uniref:ABC transporter domain-containing protein n=1 Tax=Eucalyptus globulus TaxID=34317 RepID=A0ABD3KLY3_EUCGL
MAASNGSEFFEVEVEVEGGREALSPPSNMESVEEDESKLLWAAIERLPSQKRPNMALLTRTPSEHRGSGGLLQTKTIDVRKLDRLDQELVVRKALATNDQDNHRLLSAMKEHLDRFENLNIGASVQSGSRALPTLVNYTRNMIEDVLIGLRIFRPQRHSLTILKNISGAVKPGRREAAARTVAHGGQAGSHGGRRWAEPQLELAEQPLGSEGGDLARLENEKNIRPSPEIDAFMKASSVGGKRHSISTEYVLKVLGLDICADTFVGNDMLRGVSGGQRKRVTMGEMIVGPRKTLFMDEISTGLDSSTTYQIVKCVRNFVHLMEATVLMALLQPAPETFDLFDDLVLLSEGHVVYQGPRSDVTSRKDQAQYWADPSRPYEFLPVSKIAEAFRMSRFGSSVEPDLAASNVQSNSHPNALSKTNFAVSRWELFKTCFAREVLLIGRHRFLYIFRTCQVAFVGLVTCTIFLRTRVHPTDETNGNLYLSCLFFGLIHMMFNGFSELPITISRLPVFYNWILRVPYSIIEAVVWSCVVYYTVGFAPGVGRFFRFMLLLFAVHQMALGLFRMMATIARDMVVANTFGSAALLVIFLLSGFIIPKSMIKAWWVWGFWVSPLSYGQNAMSVNEFTATGWMEKSAYGNNSVGYNVLQSHSLPSSGHWYWLGVGVLLLYALLFNNIVTLALAYLNPIITAQSVIPVDETGENSSQGIGDGTQSRSNPTSSGEGNKKKGMILPFQPLTLTFHDVNYFVDMPKAMRSQGIPESKLQLLSKVSGVFSPGVLTALVGSSGAGKTTLLDVLAGRKTGGYIEGDIRISGHPKQQHTFARVSGYVEQNDIHSPQVTVEESLRFSASLHLPKEVSKEKKAEFVEEVMKLVELDTLRHALVGLPGSSGLSTEQRKRLTIAVELVANPSIIFMDEPTSGLDARAAAIVMRTVRNTVDTGRTVVCTIHQPSIDIFEAFDELLLMKRGGCVIYGGKLGTHSQTLIDYFQGINGITPIRSGYNPATWMLEVTTPAAEQKIGADFADIYRNSDQFREVEATIERSSVPPAGSRPLKFDTMYSQDKLSQFFICLWKQNLVYWRSPQYNAVRIFFTTLSALILGSVFWNVGSKRESPQDLFVVMGALYASCLFLGVNNASSVQPIVSIERTVFYREKAAGMYSPLAYAAAQGLVEIPYVVVQTIIYGVITYFMVNFERTARKFFLFLVFMFLTFTYFTFYGMMAVGLTPSPHLAAVISSAFYSLWNLLSGFLVPKPNIPGWWIWFYYICPVAWTLRGVITSQLGDVDTQIVGPSFKGSVKEYLEVSLGYGGSGMIGVSVAVLIGFNLFFFAVFAFSVKVLNFQRR